MLKYRVTTENDFLEFDSLEMAQKHFDYWKDEMMADGVVADESFIELTSSDDCFESETTIKKLLAVIDEDRTELRTPREEGYDWDYWAKWQEIDVSGLEDTQ